MSVRIRPGEDPASDWTMSDDDTVADPAEVDQFFDPPLTRPERTWSAPDGIGRRAVAAVLVVVVGVLLLGGLAYRLSRPAPVAATVPPTTPAGTPAPTSGATASPGVSDGPELTAMPWQGAALPVSDVSGPQRFTETRSSGFSRDPQGAALAAVHISTHIDPYTGPDVFTPTITEQVLGAEGLVAETQKLYEKAARAHGLGAEAIADGTAVLAPTGAVTGWQIESFDPDGVVTVELLVRAPQGQQMVYEIPVVWQDGDWRITFQGSTRGPTFRVTEAADTDGFTPFITRGR